MTNVYKCNLTNNGGINVLHSAAKEEPFWVLHSFRGILKTKKEMVLLSIKTLSEKNDLSGTLSKIHLCT